jgi:hypothetical protein
MKRTKKAVNLTLSKEAVGKARKLAALDRRTGISSLIDSLLVREYQRVFQAESSVPGSLPAGSLAAPMAAVLASGGQR